MSSSILLLVATATIDTVRIGALFPLLKPHNAYPYFRIDSSGVLRLQAFLMALDEINNKADGLGDWLLPNTTLQFALRDSRRDSLSALVGALELTATCSAAGGGPVVATVGAASSDPTRSAANAFAREQTPQISYSSTSAALSSADSYPYFLRTCVSDDFQAVAMVDLLVGWFRFEAVATISSTDSYATAGIAAFNREAAKRGLRIVTSQSISADSGDFTTAYRELAQNRARVVVLFCQSRDAAAFLSGALDYVKDGQPHPVAGPGFLYFGSDAVAKTGTWKYLSRREEVMKGFFGLLPSSGQGTAAFDDYRDRIRAASTRLRTLPWTSANQTTCDPATDADGARLWSQTHSRAYGEPGSRELCIGVEDPTAFNAYAPHAYDAAYAIAHALHLLIYEERVDAIRGDELLARLLNNVSFVGITGGVEFDNTPRYQGDRRVGVSYTIVNYHNASDDGAHELVQVGVWKPCNRSADEDADTLGCDFESRFEADAHNPRVYSTEDGTRPQDVERVFCGLEQYTPVVASSGDCLAGGVRNVSFVNSSFGCKPRDVAQIPCHHLHHGQSVVLVSYIVCGIGLLIKVYLLARLVQKRAEKRVRRTQPVYAALLLVGGCILDLMCFALQGPPSVTRCLLSQAYLPIGFAVFFSPLAFKTLRVWRLLGRNLAQAASATATNQSGDEPSSSQPNFKVSESSRAKDGTGAWNRFRRKHPGLSQILNVAALVCVHLVAIAICVAASPSSVTPLENSTTYVIESWQREGGTIAQSISISEVMCPNLAPTPITTAALHLLLLLVTLRLAWICRHVFTEFNESASILFVCILIGLAALILIPLSSIPDLLDRGTAYILTYIVIVVITSLVSLIVLGGKLLPCFDNPAALVSYEAWLNKLRGDIRASFGNTTATPPRLEQMSASAIASTNRLSWQTRRSSLESEVGGDAEPATPAPASSPERVSGKMVHLVVQEGGAPTPAERPSAPPELRSESSDELGSHRMSST